MKITKALQATAYHEAGHAVIAWWEGLKVASVSIEPDETTDGRVLHRNPLAGIRLDIDNSTRARLRVERSIRVLLAGAIAQKKFESRGFRAQHAAVDFERAADLIERIVESDEEATAYLKLLEVQTKNALARPHLWEAVDNFAAALLRNGHLNASKVRALLKATPRPIDVR